MNQAFDKPSFVTLNARGLIRVEGADAFKFLQNLLSNDLSLLDSTPLLHACLLTPQGKFLHEVFVSKDSNSYLLECEGGPRTADLLKRLTMYKLRANLTLTADDRRPVYVVFNGAGLPDPRHPSLGSRSFDKPDLPELPFEAYDDLRIRLGIADGSRDAELEKSTLEELNMAPTAVSFTKGCYVGQELTARMEHRGLGKRHLQALGFAEAAPAYDAAVLLANGREIGNMRSSCGHVGMALLRDDALEELRNNDDTHFIYLLGRG